MTRFIFALLFLLQAPGVQTTQTQNVIFPNPDVTLLNQNIDKAASEHCGEKYKDDKAAVEACLWL